MKLLLLTSRFPFGPKESFLTAEVERLAESFDISVIPARPTSEPLTVPFLRHRSMRLRLLSPAVLSLAASEFFCHPSKAARVFASVVGKPSALHAKIKNALAFPTGLAVANIARTKRIEHVHAYWLSAPATIAYIVSELCAIPWSATGHRYDLVDFNVRGDGNPNPGFLPAARFVRTISLQGAQRLAAVFRRSRPPVRVIHLGVRIPAHKAGTAPQREGLHLLCAANLEAVKGHEVLIDALERASQRCAVRATFVGDGTMRAPLEARVKKLGSAVSVRFEGAVPHDRLLERMASGEFDAAILTSIDDGPASREGIPVFLMEAMAYGLPVIATNSGATGELADDENALVSEPRDSEGIADAIVRLSEDYALRARLSAAGRSRVEKEFNASRNAAALGALIRDGRSVHPLITPGVTVSA